MNQTDLRRAALEEAAGVARAYARERLLPHPALGPYVPGASLLIAGSVAFGAWDEHADLDLRLLLPDETHAALAAALREMHVWDPAEDFRLSVPDRRPFRRFPGVRVRILSAAELRQEFQFDLPVSLWTYSHAAVAQDPAGILEGCLREAFGRFRTRLPHLRCEHYYRFRRARSDLAPCIAPQQAITLLAIERGEAAREALRLAFLADGLPYPDDRWLERMAEEETRFGPSIVPAVRALLTAQEADAIDHASKVLRDRVAFALQQGGVTEPWLEQWWLWPTIAPGE